MKGRIAELIVVCEDQHHQTFMNIYLAACNLGRTRFLVAPSGSGSGERFVRETWIPQLAAYRNAASRRRAALLIVVDADKKTVEERERQLFENVSAPLATEAVAILIPKQNIETWILALGSDPYVDEQTDFRNDRRVSKSAIRDAARALYGLTRMNAVVPENTIPSIVRGIAVLRQFELVARA